VKRNVTVPVGRSTTCSPGQALGPAVSHPT
jgi:hypothetical protein